MDLFITFLLGLALGQNPTAMGCDGTFEQQMTVENEKWLWKYSSGRHSISGETLFHIKHRTFTMIGAEDADCIGTRTCSVNRLTCAISHAMILPAMSSLQSGRVQINSHGLYLSIRSVIEDTDNCDKAYAKYYSEVRDYWKRSLAAFGDTFSVVDVHPREIKLDKPAELGEMCFDLSSDTPRLWRGVDHSPVVTIEVSRDDVR